MKYIITWVLVKMIPCPPTPAIVDEFGRSVGLNTVSTINCRMAKFDTLVKAFSNRSEAIEMYDKGKIEMKKMLDGWYLPYDRISEIKLDSIKTK